MEVGREGRWGGRGGVSLMYDPESNAADVNSDTK